MKGTKHMQGQALAERLIAELPKRFPVSVELHVESIRLVRPEACEVHGEAPANEPPTMVSILFNILPTDADPNAAAWPQTEIQVPGDFDTSPVEFVQDMARSAAAVDLITYARCGIRHFTDEETALQADEDDDWIEKRADADHAR